MMDIAFARLCAICINDPVFLQMPTVMQALVLSTDACHGHAWTYVHVSMAAYIVVTWPWVHLMPGQLQMSIDVFQPTCAAQGT